jgi:type I restriction enzyme S subunit
MELGDLIEFQRGYDLPKSGFKKGIIPVISSNGILGYHNEAKAKGPGITIGRSGTVGLPHLITQDFFPHNTALFIKDFKGNNVKYIFYLLKSLRLNEYKRGSGVPTMNRNHLHPIKIQASKDIQTQQKIASVLSALDDKIALNNKIKAALEAMAKTLYDYWFVQFDFPNEDGKPYKSSGGEMVYNEVLKREIPEGWEVKKIDALLQKENGQIKIPSSEYLEKGEIPIIYQSTEFIAGYTNNRESLILGSKEPRVVFGDHTRILKFVNFDFSRGADGTQVLLSNNYRMPQHLFFYALKTIDLSNYGYARHFKFLKDNTIVLPEKNLSERFESIVSVNYKKIRDNIFQNQELASLRDWLLPMLMNGQVTVVEGYKEVEENLGMVADGEVKYGK